MSKENKKVKDTQSAEPGRIELLEQKVKNAKIFQIFTVALLLGSVGFSAYGMNSLDTKLTNLEKSVEETKDFVGYEDTLSTSEKEKKANEFMESDYVKEHTLAADTKREKMFSLEDDVYYVFFHMPGCSHCLEVESKLDKYLNREDKRTIYFYDASNIGDKTDLKWVEDGNSDVKYEATKDDLELVGTPTLMEVRPDGKASLFIGDEAIIGNLGL